MRIQVALHTVLQQYAPPDVGRVFDLQVNEGITIGGLLAALNINMQHDALIFVVNHRMVDETEQLTNEDRLDIVPAISGG